MYGSLKSPRRSLRSLDLMNTSYWDNWIVAVDSIMHSERVTLTGTPVTGTCRSTDAARLRNAGSVMCEIDGSPWTVHCTGAIRSDSIHASDG